MSDTESVFPVFCEGTLEYISGQLVVKTSTLWLSDGSVREAKPDYSWFMVDGYFIQARGLEPSPEHPGKYRPIL